MRRTIRGRTALLAMIAFMAIGVIAPTTTAAADPPDPRVVLIVGPSGAATDRYRAEARAAAAVARDYTSDVTEIYSPNATWPVVRDALQGASLVIYMGHGNGWPSKYRDALYGPTQNGFGLNPKPGGDDTAHQYFGETRIAKDIRFATNAVVLLHHLCYASGLSEPGLPEGTLDEAKQRVDNFAAGFIAAGADAVIAEAYSSPARYVAAILGGKRSIDTIWRTAPNANGNLLAFESTRSPGYLAQMDPASPDSGFERSIVLKRGLVAADVLAGASGAPRAGFIADPLLPSLVQTGIALRTPTLTGSTLAGSTLTLRIPYTIADRGRLPESIGASLRWEAVDRPVTPASPPATVDLVTAEVPGAVVEPSTFKMVSTKLGLPIRLPDVPGTYRLTVTLHDDAGLAFDAATQALLPTLLVRVTGEVDGAVLAPTAATIVPGTDATTLPVSVVNLGTSPWGRETAPSPFGRPVEPRVTAILVGSVVPLTSAAGTPPIPDIRVRLPAGLAPGATAQVALDLSSIGAPGDYLVVFDVRIPDHGSLIALGLPPTIVRVHVDEPLPAPDPDTTPTTLGPS